MQSIDTAANWPSARKTVRQLSASKIREVANAGLGVSDVLAFWFGEPFDATPTSIRTAAKNALDAGDTFYQHNLGLPALRNALSRYLTSLRQQPVVLDRIAITSAGVNALMLAAQLIIEPGDQVVAVTPLWPNIIEIPKILGANVHTVGVELNPTNFTWELSTDKLIGALSPHIKAIMINSPNNPTGWVMPKQQWQIVVDHCRKHGIWIISDEAYDRLVFDGSYLASSPLDICTPYDRLIVASTFSKSWQMTGWRLGWLVVPPNLINDLSTLIEFNTSCAPGFIQQAGLAAIESGEAPIRAFVDQLHVRSDLMLRELNKMNRITAGRQQGAMYAFFKIAGEPDSLDFAKRLVRDYRLGLAPGIAFGEQGEGYLRWCFAKPEAMLYQGLDRLSQALK